MSVDDDTLANRTRARFNKILTLVRHIQEEGSRVMPPAERRALLREYINHIAVIADQGLADGLRIGCHMCGGTGSRVLSTRQGTAGIPCWCNAVLGQRFEKKAYDATCPDCGEQLYCMFQNKKNHGKIKS